MFHLHKHKRLSSQLKMQDIQIILKPLSIGKPFVLRWKQKKKNLG